MQDATKPKGIAKIWRELKRPFKQFIRYKQSKLSGMSVKQDAGDNPFLSELYVRSDGRVNIDNIEIDIVLGCNLRCYHCTHFSPYRKGYIPTETIIHWFETWSKKIHPNTIKVLGGEPFLHPELSTVLYETRRIWNDVRLIIVSNGLLIPQAPQSSFDALREAKFHVIVSDHSSTDFPYEKIVSKCEENEISYELRPSNQHWWVQHQWNEHCDPIPFQSPPYDAWLACYSKYCPSLANNLLYKCPALASIIEGVNEGSLSPQHWKDVLTHGALSSDADADTILKYFRTREVRECYVCPSKVIITEPRQISHLSRIDKNIT